MASAQGAAPPCGSAGLGSNNVLSEMCRSVSGPSRPAGHLAQPPPRGWVRWHAAHWPEGGTASSSGDLGPSLVKIFFHEKKHRLIVQQNAKFLRVFQMKRKISRTSF